MNKFKIAIVTTTRAEYGLLYWLIDAIHHDQDVELQLIVTGMHLSKEFGKSGITVNAIGPSPIKTDLIKNVGEGKLNELLRQQAISKFGSFEDISNVIDFYISEKSDMITGQIIYLGGVF